jgi:hypothetical protein
MGSDIDRSRGLETMTKKRSMESSSALAEASPKRPCGGTNADTDSFEEFLALLQRIEAAEKPCWRSRGAYLQKTAVKCSEAGKADDAKAVTSQTLWRPSFEWEDFLPRGNGTRDVDWKAGDRDLKGRERERERVSPEASLDGERSWDLNLPLELMPL